MLKCSNNKRAKSATGTSIDDERAGQARLDNAILPIQPRTAFSEVMGGDS